MSPRELPARPNLEHLKKQAKQLLREYVLGEAAAIARFRAADVSFAKSAPKLASALRVMAREYGFDNWAKLKAHVLTLCDQPVAALQAAIKANDAALVRKVLARHPSLKTQLDEPLPNYGFDTPALIAAVQRNNRELVDALLDAGANINARTKWWAGSFGVLDLSSPELTPYLIERGAYVDVHAASRLGMFDRLRKLIEADPVLAQARGGDGQTPLHFAASIEIAAYLLEHGAEIDARCLDHESTPAQYMAAHSPRRPDVAHYLISRGAQTDILMAAAIGDLELVQRHLDHDPQCIWLSVTQKDFPKRDPRSAGVIYIYSFGWGTTPHMIAREFGHEEVFRLLMDRSPLDLRMAQAIELGDEELARELLAHNPNLIRALSPNVRGRLVGAARRNETRAVSMMLQLGWPARALDDNHQTALHWAAFHGNSEMVSELLRHYAPLDAQELEFKGTPVGWALYGSKNGWHRATGDYVGSVEALLAAGAKAPQLTDDLEASEEVVAALRRQVAPASLPASAPGRGRS
jgi:ankyrin repeat protein